MFVLARALTYATLFVALVLVLLPARVLEWSATSAPAAFGAAQLTGLVIAIVGGGIALWCVLAFAMLGQGTPAPFDPPRRLVVRGPYKFVRNPMYLGAIVALTGAAVYYQSLPLLAFAAVFALITHLFVIWYEEPTLAQAFDGDYAAYRSRVHRWLPKWRAPRSPN